MVCGAGINCVGVAPDGRHVRFPALGTITGDWGGGHDVGLAAVSAAARSEDGRGPKTTLEARVPAHFGLSAPRELAEAMHLGRIPARRVLELAPVVFAAAESDAVAAEIVDRLAAEVVALARVAVTRLSLEGEPVEVLLGGGLMRAANGRLEDAIAEGLHAVGPRITARVCPSRRSSARRCSASTSSVGDPAAHARLRRELAVAAGPADELATTGSTTHV